MAVTTITLHNLASLLSTKPIVLIDVRTPAEYEEIHIAGSRSYPLERFDPQSIASEHSTSEVYVICQSGTRAKMACEKLNAAGLNRVILVEGAAQSWDQSGIPVIRGRKTISLERQVRIVAGSLVLIGAILGTFVHIGFFGLSAFVGAGLLFAGITDTCGMGMVLARMPWNSRVSKANCTTSQSSAAQELTCNPD